MMASAPSPDDFLQESVGHSVVDSQPKSYGGLIVFFAVMAGVVALDLILSLVRVPLSMIIPLGIFVTVLVVAAPMLALYKAGSVTWSPKLAAVVFLGGVITQITLLLLASHLPHHLGIIRAIFVYTSQAGLLTWCLGLGALVSLFIKDKNFLLPIAFFLAAFDVFLVLTPTGPTQIILKTHPELFTNMAYGVPRVQTQPNPTQGPVRPFAYIGPADFLFLGMYFISLFRFKMRTRETLAWIVPTLLGYLAIVIFFSDVHIGRFSLGALPALLPIGTVVLLVNRKEWKLNKEEKLSTAVIAAIAVALVVYGMTRPAPKPTIIESAQSSNQGHVAKPAASAPPKPSAATHKKALHQVSML